MDPITVVLSMSPTYKIILIAIGGIVGFTIYLILKTLKKPKSETTIVKEPIKNEVESIPKPITTPEPPPHIRNFPKQETDNLRPYQREGIHGYTRKPLEGLELELDIKRKAEELTKEEAWRELSTSFWNIRREALKQFYPEIYEEIRYWETHLDEYNTRIGLMWVFDTPFGEHDRWVKRS